MTIAATGFEAISLASVANGRNATVRKVEWDRLATGDAKRLRALGIDEGAEVCVAHRGMFGAREPLALRLGRTVIALRLAHAEAIMVVEQA